MTLCRGRFLKQVRLARFSFLCVIGDEALFSNKSLCTLCFEVKLSFPTRFGKILLWVVVGGGGNFVFPLFCNNFLCGCLCVSFTNICVEMFSC